jgi:cytochrome oxidase assembly protein ShyY1
VYRLLLSPRWIGGAVLTLAAAVVMVMLGNWQFDRYTERSAINDRIDAWDRAEPVPVATVLRPAAAPGTAGPRPAPDAEWARVRLTGRYDPGNEVLIRGRTVAGRVGYEVVTPVVLADGGAVLVDRGWVPPAPSGATALPAVPAAPVGEVTVVGRVRPPETRGGPVERRDGRLQTRRIDVERIARHMPYPVYGGFVLLGEQTPPADRAFAGIPVEHERAWQNGGYAVQWWLFAAMALGAYVWLGRREARGPGGRTPRPGASTDRAAGPAPPLGIRP